MHTFMDPDFAKDAVYFQARGIGGRILGKCQIAKQPVSQSRRFSLVR